MSTRTTNQDANTTQVFLDRLDALERRLEALANSQASIGLTEPDPKTGERWDAGQVWAHLAEFLPYWIAQARLVVTSRTSDPIPFGRVKSDPGRLAAIERWRTERVSVLLERVRAGVVESRAFLTALDPRDWTARGQHSTLGVMDLRQIVEEFVVGHLEEHATQLERLTADPS